MKTWKYMNIILKNMVGPGNETDFTKKDKKFY